MNSDNDELFYRRRLIKETVLQEGFITHSELKAKVKLWREKHNPTQASKELGAQSIADDVQFWKKLWVNLKSVECTDNKRERQIIDEDAPHAGTKDPRSMLRIHEKNAIARVCMGMICGFGFSTDEDPDSDTPATPAIFSKCATWTQIRAELTHARRVNSPRARSSAERVLNCLERMYHEEARSIAFDAGTTNDKTVNLISQLRLPSSFSKLCHLTICTNSRGIFEVLGKATVQAKVIIVGGEQRWRTEAVAGRLAESFLKSSELLQFGITFVGATIVDTTRHLVCSDSQEEARLKSLLFERSSVRVVCADFSKWQDRPMRTVFGFAHFNPEHFDLIVTDAPAKSVRESKDAFDARVEDFHRHVSGVESHGIPVYISPRAGASEEGDESVILED